jgi:hypothetical protein
MSMETLQRVYGHHHPEYQRKAAENISRRPASGKQREAGGEDWALSAVRTPCIEKIDHFGFVLPFMPL